MEFEADGCGKAPAGPYGEDDDGRAARRKSAIGFGLAVSALCAIAGGAVLAYLPGVSMGAAYGLGFGGLLFLMSLAFYHVPMLRPIEEMSWATFKRAARAAAALFVAFYGALIVALFGQAAAATAVMLVADVAGAVFLGWFLCNTEGGSSVQSSPSPIEDMV